VAPQQDSVHEDAALQPAATPDSTESMVDAAAAAARAFLERLRNKGVFVGEDESSMPHVDLDAAIPQHTADNKGLHEDVRRVHFCLDVATLHEITPYSEVYGLHPRDFVFDRDFYMVPAAPGGYVDFLAAMQCDWPAEEDEEDQEWIEMLEGNDDDSDDESWDD